LYLSPAHRDTPDKGCPLPTMASELGQRGQPSDITDELIQRMLATLEARLPGDDNTAQSLTMMSTLIGAVVLSRSAKDPQLADRILDTTREQLKKQVSEM
jgi:hypothetical protein